MRPLVDLSVVASGPAPVRITDPTETHWHRACLFYNWDLKGEPPVFNTVSLVSCPDHNISV